MASALIAFHQHLSFDAATEHVPATVYDEVPRGAMSQPFEELALLHLSDTQFGRSHRFERGLESLAARLIAAFDELLDEFPRIELIVVSGDIADRGLRSEFTEAAACLTEIREALGLQADRIVIVPGNHDVSCDAITSEVYGAKSRDEVAEPPYASKWQNYLQFATELRGGEGAAVDQFHFFPALNLAVSALNSTINETCDEHHGFCGVKQLHRHAERLREHSSARRIAVVHHSLRNTGSHTDDVLTDANDFTNILSDHLDLILHGHRHDAGADRLTTGVHVLSTGSAGVASEQHPDETPNQCQVLSLGRDRVRRLALRFDHTKKRWVHDTSISKKGDSGVAEYDLRRRDAQPGAMPAAEESPRRIDPVADVAPPPHPLEQIATRSDIDDAQVQRFIKEARPDGKDVIDGAKWPFEVIGRLGLLRDKNVTRGAVLLFGRDPQREIPAARVRCVKYEGSDLTSERKATFVDGTISTQIDAAREFVERHTPRREHPDGGEAQAHVTFAYPTTCVREVIVNAVVHRDYSDETRNVHIRVFSDRVEVTSPGQWYSGKTVTNGMALGELASHPRARNPRLAYVMTLLRYLEGEGSGIPTAVQDAQAIDAEPPTVREEDGVTVVSIFPSRFDPRIVEKLFSNVDREVESAVGQAGLRLDGTGLHRWRLARTERGSRSLPDTPRRSDMVDADAVLRADDRRIVVEGGPGSGKTSMVTHLRVRLAATRAALPVLVSGRDLAKWNAEAGDDLSSLISQTWLGDQRDLGPDIARAILRRIPTVIFVDSLDEIRSMDQRIVVMRLLSDALDALPHARAVVLTRPTDLSSVEPCWQAFELAPWSMDALRSYAESLRGVDPGAIGPLQDLVGMISRDERLCELAGAPLVGVKMIETYRVTSRLPHGRFGLFRTGVELLLDRWDTRREREETILLGQQRDAAQVLAITALRDHVPFDRLPWDWCVATLTPLARSKGYEPEPLLRAMVSRGSTLIVSGDDCVKFQMTAVADYLAAEGLEKELPDTKALIERALQLAADSDTKIIAVLVILIRGLGVADPDVLTQLVAYKPESDEVELARRIALADAVIEQDPSAASESGLPQAIASLQKFEESVRGVSKIKNAVIQSGVTSAGQAG